ncbi:MAG: HAD family hydrolase [Bacillota bacterium]
MFKTLLFDLDGTLLPLDREEFITRYLESIAPRFAHLCKPADFVKKLLQSTHVMMVNKNPEKTNEEVFWEDFIPRTGLSREELLPIFTDYYSLVFPGLRRHTRPEPLAQRIVDLAFAQKREVVIATNPVFPETAIRQRLKWVGIDHLPFRLITTYENMHFCKPYLEYYEEILTKLNRDPRECLMIGNDTREDLAAAGVGIATYLVKNHLVNDDTREAYETNFEGYLEDLHQFICSL